MKDEIDSLRDLGVYTEFSRDSATSKPISARWVLRWKDEETVKARLVARGFTQEVDDGDSVFASTPLLLVLQLLLTISLASNW